MADNWGPGLLLGRSYSRWFNTVGFNGNNVSFDGAPTPAIAAFKGSNLTEFSGGLSLITDVDGKAGIHRVDLDLSNANFDNNESYTVFLSAGSVDGVDFTNRVLAIFDIINLSGLPLRNQPYSDIVFPMYLTADGSPALGLTGFTITRKIDSGSYGPAGGVVSEAGGGTYEYDATNADMNGAKITFRFEAPLAEDSFYTVRTVG